MDDAGHWVIFNTRPTFTNSDGSTYVLDHEDMIEPLHEVRAWWTPMGITDVLDNRNILNNEPIWDPLSITAVSWAK